MVLRGQDGRPGSGWSERAKLGGVDWSMLADKGINWIMGTCTRGWGNCDRDGGPLRPYISGDKYR